MKNLVEDTIEKIRHNQIRPVPKWKHLAKRYGNWMLFGFALLLGGLSFSVSYFLLANLDWDLYRFMHQGKFPFILSILPYFWLILIAIFLTFSLIDIRKSENGYRFSWLRILTITLGIFLMLGIAMSFFGIGRRFDSAISKGVPNYGRHMMVTKETQWMQPVKGLLAGSVLFIGDGEIEIKDLNGKNWKIEIDDKTLVRLGANIGQGEMIKIIGKEIAEDRFRAVEIRPWVGRGMMREGGRNMMNRPGRIDF